MDEQLEAEVEALLAYELMRDHGHLEREHGSECKTCRRRAKLILHVLYMNRLEIVRADV